MVELLLDNILIIFLAIIAVILGEFPVLTIMLASVLMIYVTYSSFCDEQSKLMKIAGGIIMLIFAMLTGNSIGFLIFFLQKDIKAYYRILIGMVLSVICFLLIHPKESAAICMLQTILLVTFYMILVFIQKAHDTVIRHKIDEKNRVIQSNISELHEKRLNEQLVMQKLVDEKNARLLERENISRNIHNSVGHSITAAIMTLDAADMLYDVRPEDARKKMNDANERIKGSLESIRRAVRVLDDENKKLLAKDLKEELNDIAVEFVMDTKMEVYSDYSQIEDRIELPNEIVVFLTGVFQECLTNGVKHGNADKFVVFLIGDSAHIRIEISDNGRSNFRPDDRQKIENGFGLKKIETYVMRSGGKIRFSNDNGFKTMIELPVLEDKNE